MIVQSIAATGLFVVALVAFVHAWRGINTAPPADIASFRCVRCGRGYRTDRMLALHVGAQHLDEYAGEIVSMGCSVSGRPAVSKSADGGSIPSHPAKQGASS